MKVRCEDTKERIKTNQVGSKRQVYPSSSDEELPSGLCPCIPSPCFIYKGILSMWKRHDLSSGSDSLVLCQFKDQSNSSCMTTLAFLISEVREIEDLLSSIEQDTNIRHDRSRGKLLQLKQEIMDTLLVSPSEKTEVIQEFMDKIKAYKKKLILVNLENALNRNDSIYAESLASNTPLDKLLTRNVTIQQNITDTVATRSTKCDNAGKVKCQKKQNVNWPWKCWTRNTFSKDGGHVKGEKRHKRFSNTISGSKKFQAERKGLGVVQSWPAFSPRDKGRSTELSTPFVIEPKIPKECQTEKRKTREKKNQTSKGSVNQGISAQSIFLKEVLSLPLCKDKATGSNVMLRPGVSRSISAQSGSLVLRCEGVTQTMSEGSEVVSMNHGSGCNDSMRQRAERLSSELSLKQLSQEDDYKTTSCSQTSIAVLAMTSESETMDDYDVSSCVDDNPPLEVSDHGLWFISAKQLCDEMFEKAYIACQ